MSLWGRTVYGLNIVFSALLLLACIVPYTKSASFAFLSLTVPLLVFLNIFFVLYWSIVSKKKVWLSFSVLVIGYFSLGSFLFFNESEATKSKDNLKIMSFNVQGFNELNSINEPNLGEEIVDFIKRENPDIICIQEFSRVWYKKLRQYPYFSQTPYTTRRSIQGIFSKYPIIGEGSLDFPDTWNNAIYVDIKYKEDTIRIYNLHLESLKVRPRSLKRERSDRLLGRLRNSFAKQQEQADLIREHMKKVDFKKIVCADMNTTQHSYAYHELKQDMEDTFEKKGSGYGRTINFWKFPLRIDFILTDPGIHILSHTNYDVHLSDHEPIMATLKIESDK